MDGADVHTLSADELYRRVGFVLQETQLVHGTVTDNIALADPDAEPERVRGAARAAQIDESGSNGCRRATTPCWVPAPGSPVVSASV